MKYLVTGYKGQLGYDVVRELKKRNVSDSDILEMRHAEAYCIDLLKKRHAIPEFIYCTWISLKNGILSRISALTLYVVWRWGCVMMSGQDVIMSGVHVDLTDSIKSVVNDKINKLFAHSSSIIRVRVILEASKNKTEGKEFIARGKVEIGGPDIEATASTDDLYKSIDDMVNKLDRQLVDRTKTKNRTWF